MAAGADKIARDLAKVVRGDVFGDVLHRVAYSRDASIYCMVPQCVVAPREVGDVVAVVRYAGANGIAVVARGAGSGVAGEALSSGIVFDMTRYMRRIVRVEDNGRRVVCEPGVVLDELNERLADFGRKIGPDPSSGNRATVGGCVANNATGAHSLEYGYIGDYVGFIEAVLADGSVVEFRNEFDPAEEDAGQEAREIGKKCLSVLSDGEEVIKRALPETKRNRSGYTIAGACHDGKIDMARMLVGSEGTLGIFTKIGLRTVALPAAKGLVQFEFESLSRMAEAAPIIVKQGASACELMDKTLIDTAIDALPKYRDILAEGAAAVLLVEHAGESESEVREKREATARAVGRLASGRRIVLEPNEQERLWKCRKDAVPLLDRGEGHKHPVPFIEDVSVGGERLGEYISGLERIGEKYDISMSFYGHAGDGELHIRPYLDLSEPDEVEKMRSIANDVFSLAWSLGGTISGEHADGLVRAAFIKGQYGEEFYELLRKVKKIFDPAGLMNPGKIISDDAEVMVSNLWAAEKLIPERLRTDLFFGADELELELEQCSGCGVCLSRERDLRMCPVFRAVGEELGSSRAKVNVLRAWATGRLGEEDFESADFRKFLDLCVNCKACSVECPSGVDVSKLVTAARAEHVRRRGLQRAEAVLSGNRYLSVLGSVFGPVANKVMRWKVFRWVLELMMGLDARRVMPRFGWGSFLRAGRKYLASCGRIEDAVDKVAYFVDTYANYNDHELGFAVLEVLRANGVEVTLPEQRSVPLPAIFYGDVRRARKDLSYNVRHMAEAVREGYKIVCSEPSAAICLKEQLQHFVASEDAQLVSENTYELMSYLLEFSKQGKLKPIGGLIKRAYVYHSPCHLFSAGGEGASIELLKGLGPVMIGELDGGCCGLAGTFGMQKKNYELSAAIAKRFKKALSRHPNRYVLTECSACKMQIEHLSGATVIHPIKVLAEAYKRA